MSSTLHIEPRAPSARTLSPALFGCAALAWLVLSATLAGSAPIQFSIATVFLFAGPHNWIEFRYFLARLPGRWGRSSGFFTLAIAGALLLTSAYAAMLLAGQTLAWGRPAWTTALAAWNSALILWIAWVAYVHGSQTRRDWFWAIPAAFVLVAVAWLAPYEMSVGLVYLHPLVALWFVDRELKRRPTWRTAYRFCLALVPLAVGVLALVYAAAPLLPASDPVGQRIVNHSGFGIITGVSSHFLVATHTFLETLHYGVWLILMPVVGFRVAPWRMRGIPLLHRSKSMSRTVRSALVVGAAVVLVLWVCFALDYPTTRDVYFTCAMLHVLAEAPFLIRML